MWYFIHLLRLMTLNYTFSMAHLRPSYVEINLSALAANYDLFSSSSLGKHFFCPMVKANAYGHGDVQVVQALEKKGCARFGVGLVEEGVRLREKGQIRSEILVFGFSGQDSAQELLHRCMTPVVSDFSQLEVLEASATAAITIHLKINTGMNRLGFQETEIPRLVEKLRASKKIKVIGLCTHLMTSEDLADAQGVSQEQIRLFKKILPQFSSFQVPYLHVYNSSGAAKVLEMADYAKSHAYGLRTGIGLYGLLACRSGLQKQLQPVMRLKSKIVAVQKVAKGKAVSYGGTWVASRDSVVGIVPMGYADGIPTQLSNQGVVHIGNKFFPVIGRVCMDYTLIDATDLIQPLGQSIEFFGMSYTALDVAQKAGTIGYDVLTRISERVPRLFV